MKAGKKVHSVTATKGGEAHWFGERALLKSSTREATAVVDDEPLCKYEDDVEEEATTILLYWFSNSYMYP